MQAPKRLNGAERFLLATIQNGEPVDFRRRDPEDRVLRAEVVRALCVDALPRVKIDSKGLWIVGATIVGVLDLEGLALNFSLRLRGCVLKERSIFAGAKLDRLDLRGTHCVKGIDAAYIEVTTNLVLGEDFSAEGEVRLYGAKIHGDLDCSGSHFASCNEQPALNLEGAQVDGSVFLRRSASASGAQRVRFQAKGEVRLSRTKIGRDLDCSGGHFIKCRNDYALVAIGADIGGSTFLRDLFSAKGEVSFYEAKIGDNLDCGKASFMNGAGKALNATGARVGGILTWTKISMSGDIVLDYASVNQLADEVASWPAHGKLCLNGFEYKGFEKDAPRDSKKRLDWLSRQSQFTPQPYEQLISVLRRIGHEDDAIEVAIEKQERLRNSGLLSWKMWAWSHFLKLVVAHGYRPSRAIPFALVVVALGWLAFSTAARQCIMAPTEKEAYTNATAASASCPLVRSDYPLLVPVMYSLDLFLPIINLHQEDHWLPDAGKPLGSWYWVYMWLHIVLGWTLTTVLLAALAGLIKVPPSAIQSGGGPV